MVSALTTVDSIEKPLLLVYGKCRKNKGLQLLVVPVQVKTTDFFILFFFLLVLLFVHEIHHFMRQFFGDYHPALAFLFTLEFLTFSRNIIVILQLVLLLLQTALGGYLLHWPTLKRINSKLLHLSTTLRRTCSVKKRPFSIPGGDDLNDGALVFGRLSLIKVLGHCGSTVTVSSWLLPQLSTFMTRHSTIVRQIDVMNRQFTSQFFLLALLTNLPVSASLMAMLLVAYQRLEVVQKVVAWNFLALQTATSLLTLTLLRRLGNAFYQYKAPLYSVQAFLSGRAQLRQKVKLLSYFQLLNDGDRNRLKLGYTVGSVANISNFSLFKVREVCCHLEHL